MLHSEGLKNSLDIESKLFWRFSSFARGQYHRTAPARKIQNLSHFLKVYQRVEIYNLAFFYTLSEQSNDCSLLTETTPLLVYKKGCCLFYTEF